MPLYTVRFRQFVEEIAEIEVEAETPEDALNAAEATDTYEDGDFDWEDGDEIRDFEPYSVMEGSKEVLGLAEIVEIREG